MADAILLAVAAAVLATVAIAMLARSSVRLRAHASELRVLQLRRREAVEAALAEHDTRLDRLRQRSGETVHLRYEDGTEDQGWVADVDGYAPATWTWTDDQVVIETVTRVVVRLDKLAEEPQP